MLRFLLYWKTEYDINEQNLDFMAIILHKNEMFTYRVKFIYKFIQKEKFSMLSCDLYFKELVIFYLYTSLEIRRK